MDGVASRLTCFLFDHEIGFQKAFKCTLNHCTSSSSSRVSRTHSVVYVGSSTLQRCGTGRGCADDDKLAQKSVSRTRPSSLPDAQNQNPVPRTEAERPTGLFQRLTPRSGVAALGGGRPRGRPPTGHTTPLLPSKIPRWQFRHRRTQETSRSLGEGSSDSRAESMCNATTEDVTR